ncbi:MAG: hypothetical protein AVDCRST_MAG67-750 [uncultured Solirubrobacteraceae bacterium]|uniref:Uncharacterized protein n=1 Tax=uncultured Solirubrobacteraceae bacterium TaxID=1162706 RepID=A0A6J4RTT9_9ACTN|nr:MAG: hypothetical protein AVDCRST_MAG67-750 [uncultured Solirubrobacteraceae bacterium]
MLFDLRGRGRRRTVQAIYLSLAILMGGGLVLFGIGSDQSGGLVDGLVGEDGGGGGSATESLDEQIDAQLAKTRANPKDADAWAQLAIARFRRAGIEGQQQDGTYTAAGKRRLGLAAAAWERHLALDPKKPDVRAANLMVQAYGVQGLNQLNNAVNAKQIVTQAERPPSSNLYAQLAVLAYQAGDNRTGDLAGTRAVDLAPKADRKELRQQLDLLKQQAATDRAQQTATTPAS